MSLNTFPIVAQNAGDKAYHLSVPRDATVVELEAAVRAATNAFSARPLLLCVAGSAPAPATAVADLFDLCKDEDGVLRVTYHEEVAMGAQSLLPGCGCSVGNLSNSK